MIDMRRGSGFIAGNSIESVRKDHGTFFNDENKMVHSFYNIVVSKTGNEYRFIYENEEDRDASFDLFYKGTGL